MLLPYLHKDLIEAGCGMRLVVVVWQEPVYVAAVILPPGFQNEMLNDSKKLTEKQRYELRTVIEKEATAWAVGVVTPEEIDKINILNASLSGHAQSRISVAGHSSASADWREPLQFYPGIPHTTIVKGDGKYLSIAAASHLAKTYRDDYMNRLYEEYPMYDWKGNKGYPTKNTGCHCLRHDSLSPYEL